MNDIDHIGWPFTDEGPVVDAAEAKRCRLRFLLTTVPGELPWRPSFGTPLNEDLFENVNEALKVATRVAVRDVVPRYEPGVIIPPGEEGVTLVKEGDGVYLVVRYVDAKEPNVIQDPLKVRLQRAS